MQDLDKIKAGELFPSYFKPDWLLQAENCLPFWTCNNQMFRSKIMALEYASKHNTDIGFYFNDVEFSTLPWTFEPPEHIDELYLRRAKQLREKYDYIVVMYSGGSDSSTILKTFVRNGIKVDEVATYGGWSHSVDKYDDPVNLEITYAATEMLKQCVNLGIKVNYLNMLDHFEKSYSSPDWVYDADPRINPDNHLKFHTANGRQDLIDMVDRGLKVALVFGHDKPRIVFKDNAFFLTYLDVGALATNVWPQMFEPGYVGPAMEFFYPNVDVPEIMIKQGHMIVDWYIKNIGRESAKILSPNWLYDPKYQSRINTIMYPTTWREYETYSIGKPSNTFSWLWKSDFLINRMQDTQQNQYFWDGLNRIRKTIDKRFWGKWGLIGHWAKFYKIKDMTTEWG
jgi:hypothetical protein